jgi:peptide/nickel transport system substrate-binding protein
MLGAMVAASAIAGAAPAKGAAPVNGGTVVYALTPQTNIPWYLPVQNAPNYSGSVFELIGLMYQPLLWQNSEHKFDYSQSLAEKVTYNKQGTVFHIFLNPKWYWSNGQPITSADLLFSWNVLMAAEVSKVSPWPAGSEGAGGMPANFKSAQATSKYEFTITLKKPANQQWFIYNALTIFNVMPTVWNKYPNNMAEELAYLGKNATNPKFDNPVSGPFELQSATQNEEWVLVPNPNYSGQKAHISRLILQYEGSNESEFAGLKTGSIQVGYLPPGEWAARAELPDTMTKQYGFGFGFIWVNMWSGAQDNVNTIFDNLYVRQALEMGIDETAIGEVIDHGQYQPAYGPLQVSPTTTSFLDPTLDKPLYAFDPAAGLKLMESNGWKLENGVLTKGGQQMKFTLQYSSGDIATTEEMELIQADWAKEGVKVTLEPVPFAALLDTVEGKHNAWEIVGGITWGYPGYPSGEQLFYKDQGVDFAGWNNAEENSLIEATESPAATPALQQSTYFKYQLYTAKELPMLWAPYPVTDDEVAPNLHGVTTQTLLSWTDIQPQYWWLSPQ